MGTFTRSVRARAAAFTLIELLTVLAIISLLMSLLAPALSRARAAARTVRELAAARQSTAIYINYTLDFKDAVVPALPNWSTVGSAASAPPQHRLRAPDPFNPGAHVDGALSRTWFAYLQGWSGTTLASWQIERATSDEFLSRGRAEPGANGWTDYDNSTAAAAFAFHPTLGLNGVALGGSYRHGGLQGQWGLTNVYAGHFYLTRLHQARNPDRLIVFSSARGGDVSDSPGLWAFGGAYPDVGRIRSGYFLVTAPFTQRSVHLGYATPWSLSNIYKEAAPPSSWGNVAARHQGHACVASIDGHAVTSGLDELRDMRRWWNNAASADWTVAGGP